MKKRDRKYRTYKIHGESDSGRRLLLIFFVKEKSTARSTYGSAALVKVVTGWEE